ncbi:MAG: hypothetical protein P8170_03500 [Gemmatimonadota bacterium]|jgi:hypothetical protein
MIAQVFSLFEAMYEALGPGLLLAAAFPALLVALGVVVGTSLKRYGRKGGAA